MNALDNIAQLESLASICAAGLRDDGLPQDWVDDLVNLTLDQRQDLCGKLDTIDQPWARALKPLL